MWLRHSIDTSSACNEGFKTIQYILTHSVSADEFAEPGSVYDSIIDDAMGSIQNEMYLATHIVSIG